MAKDKGEEAKVEETTTTPEPEVEPTETPKTFTQEDLDAIVAEKDKAYQGLQKVIARKDQELETSRKQPTQSNTQAMKLLIEEMEAQTSEPNEMGEVKKPSPRLAQLKSQVVRLEREEAGKRHQAQLDAKRDAIRQKAEDAGLDPNDEAFDTVINALSMGQYLEADRRLDRILAKHTKKEQKVGKTEEEIRAEERTKVIEELGLKKQDGGSPSGAGVHYSAEQIGDMSYAEWKRAGKPKATK